MSLDTMLLLTWQCNRADPVLMTREHHSCTASSLL